jgi:membrane protein DedA with SNARE-associated domain
METIQPWVTEYGYAGIFSLLTLGIVGLPVPDETLLAFGGYLVYKGDLRLLPTIGASFLGSACGMSLSYGLGRTAGIYLTREYGHKLGVTGEKLAQAHAWFNRIGRWGLTIGYFFPGIRHVTAFAAGTSSLPFLQFARFTYAGGLVWSVTFILTGYYLGKEWTQVSVRIRPALLSVSAALSILVLGYFLIRHYTQKRL